MIEWIFKKLGLLIVSDPIDVTYWRREDGQLMLTTKSATRESTTPITCLDQNPQDYA